MRQPTSSPQTDMITMGRTVLARLATAWPPRTAPRAIGRDRNRSTAWFLKSLAIAIATPNAVNTIVWAKIPPIKNSR